MIQWEPPFSGTDKATNFHILVHGVTTTLVKTGQVTETKVVALVITEEGDLVALPIEQVNLDLRFDREQNGFIGIDLAAEG